MVWTELCPLNICVLKLSSTVGLYLETRLLGGTWGGLRQQESNRALLLLKTLREDLSLPPPASGGLWLQGSNLCLYLPVSFSSVSVSSFSFKDTYHWV